MPLASLPRWSRAADSEAERLNRLRARAVARLEEEERAAGISWVGVEAATSRRSVLRRFGILLAGFVPGMAALVKTQAAYAAAPSGSVRSCAPQYGAPSWPSLDNYTPPVGARVTTSRTDLGHVSMWTGIVIPILSAKGSGGWRGTVSVEAMVGYYQDPWDAGGGTHTLVAMADPDTDIAYIVRGNQTFYAVVGPDLNGYKLGPGVLSVHGSLFQRKGWTDDLTAVIADFAKVSDRDAERRDEKVTNINLEKGLPQAFWISNKDGGWETKYLTVANVQRRGDIVQLEVGSYPSHATFTVDLKAQTLLTTEFEGKKWTS